MRKLLAILLLISCPAWAQRIELSDPVPEDSTLFLTLGFRQPDHCSKTPAVFCTKAKDCPTGELCSPGAPALPTQIVYQFDDLGTVHLCVAGAGVGQTCKVDADCPGSSCAGVMIQPVTITPSTPVQTYTIPPTVATILHPTLPEEKHAATVTWSWTGPNCQTVTCQKSAEIIHRVTNLHFVPR